jgi:hypothetical protein
MLPKRIAEVGIVVGLFAAADESGENVFSSPPFRFPG